MAKKRNARSASFKAKVALEAVRERKTISELAKQHAVHPTQIHQWRKQLQDRVEEIFDDDKKRLLIVESELARLLSLTGVEGSILSAVLRDAWDDSILKNTVKGAPATSSSSHIAICAHITLEELKTKLKSVDIGNGFANRFLWVFSERSKVLPNRGDPPMDELERIANGFDDALRFAQNSSVSTCVRRSPDGEKRWAEVYERIAQDDELYSGIVSSLTARSEAQIVRLSLIFPS